MSAELSGWWSSEESKGGLGLAGALSIRQQLGAAAGSTLFFVLDEAIGASSSRALADEVDDAGGADPSAAAAAAPPDPGTAAGASSWSTMVVRLKMRTGCAWRELSVAEESF